MKKLIVATVAAAFTSLAMAQAAAPVAEPAAVASPAPAPTAKKTKAHKSKAAHPKKSTKKKSAKKQSTKKKQKPWVKIKPAIAGFFIWFYLPALANAPLKATWGTAWVLWAFSLPNAGALVEANSFFLA